MFSATITTPFQHLRPPDWASGHGQDGYGYFAEFSVFTGAKYWEFVTQRMRWIPAGKFQMGAAAGEPTFVDPETQHDVKLSHGFWLADTACTQELWEAVASDNPSAFKAADRPVENVSYDDVVHFCERLSDLIPGLAPQLPTEAQWEYACRAATKTPFSFGETISTDQVNFDGNHPYANSPKGEYREETVGVKALPANSWGLYEMHGNVWEWCRDWYETYSPELQVDPAGPEQGSARVLRGGGWIDYARNVRSACRYWLDPGNRDSGLGFRLLSSSSLVESESPNK